MTKEETSILGSDSISSKAFEETTDFILVYH